VKLVVQEAETAALQSWLESQEGETFFASQLARIELVRTVARAAPDRIDLAREVLRGLALLRVDDEIVEAAENLSRATSRASRVKLPRLTETNAPCSPTACR
jgi:hypothetical protein